MPDWKMRYKFLCDLYFKVIGILTFQPFTIEHNFELCPGKALSELGIKNYFQKILCIYTP